MFLASITCTVACAAPLLPIRTTLPIARLVTSARTEPPTQGFTLWAEPVQLGQFDGVGTNERGVAIPVAVRVPQGVPTTASFSDLAEEPAVVGSDIWPKFDRRTVALLPFGAFWIEVGNHSALPVTVTPAQLHLRIDTRTVPLIADNGATYGRWRRTFDALAGHRVGSPVLDNAIRSTREALRTFDAPAVIQPGHAWRGYAVFDTQAFSADEYNRMLKDAGTLELAAGPAVTTFAVETQPLEVVCLPKTLKPDFIHCEALVRPKP
ncbi:MAG: hypothetical protein ABI321_25005 [Polyangia bacterium]